MRYWLMKSEPDVYSIDQLKQDGQAEWEGVRNYQARNFMRDDMRVGDRVLYYHSNTKPPGVVGLAKVCRKAYPDFTQFDEDHKYYDPKASEDNPRWYMVDVEFVEKFPQTISLEALKETPGLEDMVVTRKGSRLSVQPVLPDEYKLVVKLGRRKRRG